MSENSKNSIRLPIVLCLGLAAGVLVGATLNTGKPSADVNKDVQKFREILTLIMEEYCAEGECRTKPRSICTGPPNITGRFS